MAFENAGDPDSTVATWHYVAGSSGPVVVTVNGTWSWGDNSLSNGGPDSQSCFPSNPVPGYDDVNGHWAVGIAVGWNDSSTPNTLTGKATDGTAVMLHVGSAMDRTNPNYCAGTTASAPYPSGTFTATHRYSSLNEFLADTNNGKVCVNAYDVHKPNSVKDTDPSQNNDNTLNNGHYSLNQNIDCSLAAQTPSPDLRITISPNSTNAVGAAHTFTVTVGADQTGTGTFSPVQGAKVNASLASSNGAAAAPVAGTCVSGTTDANGHCTVVVNSSTPGVVTVNASTTVTVNGVQLTRALGDNQAGDGAPATKTFVDAEILLSPLSVTNPAGTPHTFTVTVKQNLGDGNGFVALQGATVTPTATFGNGATSQPLTGTCKTQTTDSNGQCTIVVDSTTAGLVTINASTNVSVAGQSITRSTGDGLSGDSPNAVKTYVDAYITISPGTADNPTGTTHVLTAQVFVNRGDGAGYVAAPNGTAVSFALLSGSVGSFVGGSGCTTTGGACTATITSTAGGADTVQASTSLSVGGLSLTRTTGTAAPGHANSGNAGKNWIPPTTPPSPPSPPPPTPTTPTTPIPPSPPVQTFTPPAPTTPAPPARKPAPFTPPSRPKIAIVKSPKNQSLTTRIVKAGTTAIPHYGRATFTITVTNRGNVRLTDVRVDDAIAPSCTRHDLGTLAPGASRKYRCSLASVKRDYVNVAIASGKPPKGPRVTASDHAAVHVKFKTVSSAPAKYTG
ncbi:MAG TPA: hypothetical protein VFA88_11825 [Gaiellaceae bacterium]|nr:hypothetical protein [Gaiellaceae bacterium]